MLLYQTVYLSTIYLFLIPGFLSFGRNDEKIDNHNNYYLSGKSYLLLINTFIILLFAIMLLIQIIHYALVVNKYQFHKLLFKPEEFHQAFEKDDIAKMQLYLQQEREYSLIIVFSQID